MNLICFLLIIVECLLLLSSQIIEPQKLFHFFLANGLAIDFGHHQDQSGVLQERVIHRFMQVLLIYFYPIFVLVGTIHHINYELRVVIVMRPELLNFTSSSNIPHTKSEVRKLNCLIIESICWDGGHKLLYFEAVKQ